MGLKPLEVKSLHYKDFLFMLAGYQERQDAEWDRTRNVIWAVMTFGGMGGLSEPITPEQIRPLKRDKENEKRMITNLKMALELLNEFMADN